MKQNRLMIPIIILAFTFHPNLSWSDHRGCKSYCSINAKTLWFYEAQFIYVERFSRGWGFLKSDPTVCFLIYGYSGFVWNYPGPGKDQIKYSEEILIRTQGYVNALEKWAYWQPLDFHPPDWPGQTTIRERIKQLTGIHFANRKDLKKWYQDNEHYLIWSEEKSLLVVEEELKKKGEKAHDFPKRQLQSEEFWKAYVLGFGDEWKTDKYINGEILDRHTGFYDYKASLSVLKDFKAKKKAYQKLVSVCVGVMKRFKNLDDAMKDQFQFLSCKRVLRRISGRKFKDPQQWVHWYEESNKFGFTLSEDKKYIVIKKSK